MLRGTWTAWSRGAVLAEGRLHHRLILAQRQCESSGLLRTIAGGPTGTRQHANRAPGYSGL